jgi:hypothetical protein
MANPCHNRAARIVLGDMGGNIVQIALETGKLLG